MWKHPVVALALVSCSSGAPSRTVFPDLGGGDVDPGAETSSLPDGTVSSETAAPPDGATPETTPGSDADPPPTGRIGSSCGLDSDCSNDAICLDWANGYCTRPNCTADADCPDGAICAEVQAGTTACLAACSAAAPCRNGYGCKPFTNAGGVRFGCVGLDAEPSPAGGACETTTGCEGPFACLGVVEEGYCALVGCGEALPCPESTACVTYNGTPTCLRRCAVTEDCLVGGATERTCGKLVEPGGTVADVCLPATAGVGVGSQCALDLECTSGTCRIVAEGRCVGGETGCFVDADCKGGVVCEVAPAYRKGVCTLACGEDVSCPGQSACVAAANGAWCQLPCKGLTDPTSCDENLGERCLFGDPIASTASGGKYVCAVTKPGDPGEPCTEDAECKDGSCLGTCAPACPPSGCLFPTTCVETDGVLRCLKRCFSPADCPIGTSCTTTPTSAAKICAPIPG